MKSKIMKRIKSKSRIKRKMKRTAMAIASCSYS